tara:strand:- start:66 stop:818 length:753 start_codon:yes stop_codon:yes gene_type:complete
VVKMEETNRGVLYIVFGDNFIKEMLISAESVKKHNPNMHITAFSDKKIKSEFIDKCVQIKVKHLRPKVDYVHLSPYDETIFLDTDTVVDRDITEMFEILEKYDFAICHDLARKRKSVSNIIPEYAQIPYSFSEVNPGVMVFKKCQAVDDFFKTWREYFYKYFNGWPYEQPTFRVALWKSKLNFYILPVEYNIRSKGNRDKQRKFNHQFGEQHLAARIYHMHADTRINQGKYEVKSLDQALEYCKKNFMDY